MTKPQGKDKTALRALTRITVWDYEELERCYTIKPNIQSVKFACLLACDSNMTPSELLTFLNEYKSKKENKNDR